MRDYTREAGVRNLEREIGGICRKLVTRSQRARSGKHSCRMRDGANNWWPICWASRSSYAEVAERTGIPGVATGLAWTPVGGDMHVYRSHAYDRAAKAFKLTGQLGDVMRESAQAALSYVRSQSPRPQDRATASFSKSDIHLHVPAGSTPKDGPSAA